MVDRIAKKLEENETATLKECHTDTIPLCGNDFKKFKQVKKYIQEVYNRIQVDGFSEYDAWYLVTTYGKQTEIILSHYESLKNKENALRLLRAELKFGIEHEMVSNPMDFFIRRTGRMYFDIESIRTYLKPVLADFKNTFGYSSEQLNVFKENMEKELELHSNFSMDREKA